MEPMTVASTDSRYHLRILQALRRVIRAVDLHSRKLSAHYHITSPQLVCLIAIVEEGPLTATAISRRVHLSPSTVVGILDRLEKKGWIHRERDARDRRRVYITATDQGRALVGSAPSPLQDALSAALARLPRQKQEMIACSLEEVVHLMGAQYLDAAPILETGPIDAPS